MEKDKGGTSFPSSWYLIKKKRFEDLPEGIYWGAYHQKNFNINTSFTDLDREASYDELDSNNYIFKRITNVVTKYSVNRKTLLINISPFKDTTPYHTKCNEISTDRFYELVEEETKKQKKELKF